MGPRPFSVTLPFEFKKQDWYIYNDLSTRNIFFMEKAYIHLKALPAAISIYVNIYMSKFKFWNILLNQLVLKYTVSYLTVYTWNISLISIMCIKLVKYTCIAIVYSESTIKSCLWLKSLIKDPFHDRTVTEKVGGDYLKQELFTRGDQGQSRCYFLYTMTCTGRKNIENILVVYKGIGKKLDYK